MLRQPIHCAVGAIPTWLLPPSSPTMVPMVWVPWPWSSQGYGRVGAAAAAARVDGVVPVVVVVAGTAPVLVDEGGVVPEIAGVLAGNDGAAAGDAEGPDIVGVDQGDVPLDGVGRLGVVARCAGNLIHPDRRVGVDVRDIGAFGHRLDRVDPAADPDHVGDPVGAVVDAARGELVEDRPGFAGESRACGRQRRPWPLCRQTRAALRSACSSRKTRNSVSGSGRCRGPTDRPWPASRGGRFGGDAAPATATARVRTRRGRTVDMDPPIRERISSGAEIQ